MFRRAVIALAAFALVACTNLSGFTTAGDSYQGPVVAADFVLAGVAPTSSLCLTLDTNHLQDGPGAVWTSDGMFHETALRAIPQIWHDPLSTFTFGEGRLKNLMYVAAATTPFADGGSDVFVVISLMQSGDIEVRLLRGAPALSLDGGASTPPGGNLFAVFSLSRQSGPCSF
jgi:hypothetical protein